MVESDPQQPNLDDVSRFIVSGSSGSFIFQEGDPGTEMYIIQAGEVEILKPYAGETRQLAVLEPGDFFGEMSLLEELPREVSARALTDYKLLKIDLTTFDQMIQENPEIAVRMLRKLSRRLREERDAELKAEQIARQVLEGAKAEPPAKKPVPSPTGATRASLVHTASGTEFPLSSDGDTTIGRPDRAAGFLPDVDFTPFDTQRTLSRRHAKISAGKDGFYVREEMATRNGTFVNGDRIKTGVPVKLKGGDEVRFGLVKTVFHMR
jgi:CRP-like cAMP-binding protein